MSLNEIFVALVAAGLAALFPWAFRTLTGDRWQFIASSPLARDEGGQWQAANFTFYGFFSATAYAISASLFVVLMGSVGVPLVGSALAVGGVLVACVPASQLIAWVVEGKRFGFTIGGASFVGLFAVPLTLVALNRAEPWLGVAIPATPAIAAMTIVYVIGEAVGRLACISFGCCYGKPVEQSSGVVRRIGERAPFIFRGATRKTAFADDLEGVPLVPIQAITAALYGLTAVVCLWLFFAQKYLWTVSIGIVVSQVWRAYSETQRADYRGEGKVSVYQWMAIAAAAISLGAPWALPESSLVPDVARGLAVLWTPVGILLTQGLWTALFLFMGRSMQTGARLSFHVHADRV